MWAAIRQSGGADISLRAIADAGKVDLSSAKHFVGPLSKAGILVEISPAPAAVYQLVGRHTATVPRLDADGVPLPRDLRQAAWDAMRVLKEFTLLDLQITSAISIADAKHYCGLLAKAGYLKYRTKGAGAIPSRFMFVPSMNTGPKAPQISRIKVVWDANRREAVWPLAEQVEVNTK